MAGDEALDLMQLPDLVRALELRGDNKEVGAGAPSLLGSFRGTFCPSCGATRRMQLSALRWFLTTSSGDDDIPFGGEYAGITPALFVAQCLECREQITILISHGPDGAELVALPTTYGGLSTPSTPPPVSFYLDQAQRCQSVGALSAAVAMYRAALEQLLYEQGYTDGMLKKKIDNLIADQEPPRWRDQLDLAFLEAMKDLGNAAIHPNDGDISKQAAFHAGLLYEVRALFEELLEEAYEAEKRRPIASKR